MVDELDYMRSLILCCHPVGTMTEERPDNFEELGE